MLKVTIDDKAIEVQNGTTIIEAAKKVGIFIPHYCYHPGLSIPGNCRICLVEVEKQPKLQISCYTPVIDGMIVKTHSPKVVDTRAAVLEFLLVNHPLDCPVCDQSGECELQNFYMNYGLYNSRLMEVKVKKTKKAFPIGATVMLDQERCILCTRCVRFTDEISKTHELGMFNRGDHSEIDIYPGQELNNSYSGNVVDICPVGALTDIDFRFKCRVWYLAETDSICPGCSMGCNIKIHWDKLRPHSRKKERVMRLKPRYNPEVNQWWMCDLGRYDYKWIDQNRILWPQKKVNGTLQAVSWEEVFSEIGARLLQARDRGEIHRIGVISSSKLTNEDLFVIRKFFRDSLGVLHLDFRVPEKPGSSDGFLIQQDKNPNTYGATVISEEKKSNEWSVEEMIRQACQGNIEILYCFGHDLAGFFGKEVLEQVAKKVELLILQASNLNATCGYAHWILPSAVYAEKEGTFTNYQGRVQRIHSAFPPLGEAREDWRILMELAQKMGIQINYSSAEDIFNDMARTITQFQGLSYETVENQGALAQK